MEGRGDPGALGVHDGSGRTALAVNPDGVCAPHPLPREEGSGSLAVREEPEASTTPGVGAGHSASPGAEVGGEGTRTPSLGSVASRVCPEQRAGRTVGRGTRPHEVGWSQTGTSVSPGDRGRAGRDSRGEAGVAVELVCSPSRWHWGLSTENRSVLVSDPEFSLLDFILQTYLQSHEGAC